MRAFASVLLHHSAECAISRSRSLTTTVERIVRHLVTARLSCTLREILRRR